MGRAGCGGGDVPADTSGWREREGGREGEGAAGRRWSREAEGRVKGGERPAP